MKVRTNLKLSSNSSFCSLPERSLWNYRIDLEKNDWGTWNDIMAKFVFSSEVSYYDMQVPTVDTTKYG